MTTLSAKYLLIQGRSRQTANAVKFVPSLATFVLYLRQMELRVLGVRCRASAVTPFALLALLVATYRSRMAFCDSHWPRPSCTSLY